MRAGFSGRVDGRHCVRRCDAGLDALGCSGAAPDAGEWNAVAVLCALCDSGSGARHPFLFVLQR